MKWPQRGCRGRSPPAAGAGRKRLHSPLKAVVAHRKAMAPAGVQGAGRGGSRAARLLRVQGARACIVR
jgi:hypothetical protein